MDQSKWVSYIVTTVPTTTAAATGTRPSTDSNGTLVDNGDGTYKYTFYRDITQVKAQVAGMTFTGANRAADLGDLTYDPNAVHRVAMSISGNVPGTGTNTANEVQVVPGVPLAKPNNAIFDFIPATGKALAPTDPGQRLIVDKASCNECHGKLGGIPGTESASLPRRQPLRSALLRHLPHRSTQVWPNECRVHEQRLPGRQHLRCRRRHRRRLPGPDSPGPQGRPAGQAGL